MITIEDVKKLAQLARIEVSSAELESLKNEIDSIVSYVGEVSKAGGAQEVKAHYALTNVLREDEVRHESGSYTEKLLEAAPESDGGFVKVKQIFND